MLIIVNKPRTYSLAIAREITGSKQTKAREGDNSAEWLLRSIPTVDCGIMFLSMFLSPGARCRILLYGP